MQWRNKRANFDYFLEDEFEVGIVLKSSEVKSLRDGLGSITEAFIGYKAPHMMIFNLNIPKYNKAFILNSHEPTTARILLLHDKERKKMINALQKKGKTVVPISMYWSKRGKIKIKCAIATGKNKGDKRETIKKRDAQRTTRLYKT
jgi:SsrA-binding protein